MLQKVYRLRPSVTQDILELFPNLIRLSKALVHEALQSRACNVLFLHNPSKGQELT
jgi:hypothetical protein